MFQDQYTKLSGKDTKTALTEFNALFEGSAFPETSIIMRRPLAFYPDYWFYDVTDHQTMPPRRRYLIVKGQDVTVLDGRAETVLGLNKRIGITLNEFNVLDYVQFYLAFVRGPRGRMVLVESLDDIPWRDEPSPAARKAIGKMVSALDLVASVDGSYQSKAQLIFADGLYEVDLKLKPDGSLEFKEPKMLIEDMPVLDDLLA
jgi:hypothetical protein